MFFMVKPTRRRISMLRVAVGVARRAQFTQTQGLVSLLLPPGPSLWAPFKKMVVFVCSTFIEFRCDGQWDALEGRKFLLFLYRSHS